MTERPKMNQRLSAIKQQAHLYALDQEWYVDSFEQRFAELIVRECASVALMSNGNNLYVCELIKEHFGVEE
jgi:hypothetical protein